MIQFKNPTAVPHKYRNRFLRDTASGTIVKSGSSSSSGGGGTATNVYWGDEADGHVALSVNGDVRNLLLSDTFNKMFVLTNRGTADTPLWWIIPQYDMLLTDNTLDNIVSRIQDDLQELYDDRYLKKTGDTATGKMIFVGTKNTGKTEFGSFSTGVEGGMVDENGDGELNSLTLRDSLTVPNLVYNRTEVVGGNTWRCAGGGEIESVVQGSSTTGYCDLVLKDGEIGMIAVGDICMGIYHLASGNDDTNEDGTYNETLGKYISDGNFKFAGFKAIYFKITKVEDLNGYTNKRFYYELRGGDYDTHPQAHMNFACYGNTTNTSRQTSELQTRSYTLLLQNVTSYEYTSSNIVLIFGQLSSFVIGERNLSGNGLAFGNAYMWGSITQIDRVIETFTMRLSQHAIQVSMSDWYSLDGEGDDVTFEFTAQVVTSQGVGVAPTGIAVTPPSGLNITVESTTLNGTIYTVKCRLTGYMPEDVHGIGAKENAITVEIDTDVATVQDTITIIASYQGKDGEQGEAGKDGTSIDIEGSAVGHYDSYEEMVADLENIEDGIVLIDEITIGIAPKLYGVSGSFICTVADHEATDVPTSADEAQPKGTTYVSSDGHLYVAGDKGLSWTDAGYIQGADGEDAVSIEVSQSSVTAKRDDTSTQIFEISVQAFKGAEALVYMDDFECSTLADTKTITTGLIWTFAMSDDQKTFYYKLALAAGAVVDIAIPFTVTVGSVTYSKTLYFHTVESGATGKTGAMPRYRGEWNQGQVYYWNDEYRDMVLKDGDYYAVKTQGGSTTGTSFIYYDPTSTEASQSEWEKANEFKFVATELLLATQAYIKNLLLNYAEAHDAAGNVTVAIDGETGKLTAQGAELEDANVEGSVKVGTDLAYIKLEKITTGAKMLFYTKDTLDSLPNEAATMEVTQNGVILTIHSTQYGDIKIGDGMITMGNFTADAEGGVTLGGGVWYSDTDELRPLKQITIGDETFWAFQ